MSILQMSWPFGAMLALPIQAYIAQLSGWPAVMISGALCAAAVGHESKAQDRRQPLRAHAAAGRVVKEFL